MIQSLAVPAYGYCVTFLPEMHTGFWLIDTCNNGEDDSLPETVKGGVPAYYECLATANDRAEFLRSKGFEARILVLMYMPGDTELKMLED